MADGDAENGLELYQRQAKRIAEPEDIVRFRELCRLAYWKRSAKGGN